MAITLTEKAAQRVEKYLETRGKGIGLKLAVKTTGCSGMAYVLEFVDQLSGDDQVFESHGVKILVDPKSLRDGLNEGFEFHNPNVKDSCGCGESFTI